MSRRLAYSPNLESGLESIRRNKGCCEEQILRKHVNPASWGSKGRVNKFLKENCLVDQEFQFGDGDKATVAQWLAKQDKDLKIVAFKRFTLVAD